MTVFLGVLTGDGGWDGEVLELRSTRPRAAKLQDTLDAESAKAASCSTPLSGSLLRYSLCLFVYEHLTFAFTCYKYTSWPVESSTESDLCSQTSTSPPASSRA